MISLCIYQPGYLTAASMCWGLVSSLPLELFNFPVRQRSSANKSVLLFGCKLLKVATKLLVKGNQLLQPPCRSPEIIIQQDAMNSLRLTWQCFQTSHKNMVLQIVSGSKQYMLYFIYLIGRVLICRINGEHSWLIMILLSNYKLSFTITHFMSDWPLISPTFLLKLHV